MRSTSPGMLVFVMLLLPCVYASAIVPPPGAYVLSIDDNTIMYQAGGPGWYNSPIPTYIVPENIIYATVLEGDQWREVGPGSTVPNFFAVDGYSATYPFEGTVPQNVPIRARQNLPLYVTNFDGAVRTISPRGTVVTNIPSNEGELSTRHVLPFVQAASLRAYAEPGQPIQIKRASTRWELITPSEYVGLISFILGIFVIILTSSLIMHHMPERHLIQIGTPTVAFGIFGSLVVFTWFHISKVARVTWGDGVPFAGIIAGIIILLATVIPLAVTYQRAGRRTTVRVGANALGALLILAAILITLLIFTGYTTRTL